MDNNDDFGNDCDFCGEPDRRTCGCEGERLRARCERLERLVRVLENLLERALVIADYPHEAHPDLKQWERDCHEAGLGRTEGTNL